MAVSLGSLNKKYQRLGTAVLTMVGLGILQPFLWYFVNAQALNLQQERSQGQQITNVNKRNAEVTKRLETASEFLSQVDAVSPATNAKTQVVERVEQLADQLGLVLDITVIQEIALGGSEAGEDYVVPVSITLVTSGTAPQLLALLDRLEHTQELSLVSRWDMRAGSTLAPVAGVPPPPIDVYTLSMDVVFFLRELSSDGQPK